MPELNEQADWLNLVETAGPFLAEAVLRATFPQGLEKIETPRRQRLRSAYEEWQEAVEESDPQLAQVHAAWTSMVLEEGLEFDAEVLVTGDSVPSYTAEGQGETYRPSHAVRSREGNDLLFVSVYPPKTRLDQPLSKGWVTSAVERMTLLCRTQKVRVGLVTNGEQWTLVNAPVDDTSGYTSWYARLWWQEPVTFKAFVSLLGVRRFFGPAEERLDQLLQRSLAEHREVTDTLGEQVRRAVEVLVQSLGRADDDRRGELLAGVTPAELYNAGLTVMMRLVFLLCAEERELLLLGDPVYDQHYAVSTLRATLRDDADQLGEEVLERRYDAWSRLLSLFRAVYGGIEHDTLRLPAMGGSLFDPDRFSFLEGRPKGTRWREWAASPLPIDNRTVMLLLRSLQVLQHRGGARRLSYRGLDVEQIGHVYEGLLDYKVARVPVTTVGLIGSAKLTWPTIPLEDLEDLAAAGPTKAASRLAKLTGRSRSAIKKALGREQEIGDLHALVQACSGVEALARRILPFLSLLRADTWGVPLVYRTGSFAVALGSGRRESGSHYTPKALTEPIVATTLRPILEAMGEHPTGEQLLALKVCDPAMGSGAFLVEVCRQLAAHVVEAWSRVEAEGNYVTVNGDVVDVPADGELLSPDVADRLVTARRLVAEHCLYGVDKNPMAVDLAKLSLWLVTMATGRPFGFLDHKLKYGDSLVGLSKAQIAGFTWKAGAPPQIDWLDEKLKSDLKESFGWRQAIGDFGDFDYAEKEQVHEEAEKVLADARLIGDLTVAAFFGADKAKAREELRGQYQSKLEAWRANEANRLDLEGIVEEMRGGEKPLPALHWEIEFPEVFERENPGFDAIVGNPPFLGGKRISATYGMPYFDFLKAAYPGAGHLCDLVGRFFRQSYFTLRSGGTLGLLATNTVSEGDTRQGGLRWICDHNGQIYSATKGMPWPGKAAVVVSKVHIRKNEGVSQRMLAGKRVDAINSFLFAGDSNQDPMRLHTNQGCFSVGSFIYGAGFLFDDTDDKANSCELMKRIRENHPACAERIRPYLGGRELNDNPTHAPRRHVICLSDLRHESELDAFEPLSKIARERVKPGRDRLGPNPVNVPLKRRWWAFQAHRPKFYARIAGLGTVLALARVTTHFGLARLPVGLVYSEQLVVFAFDSWTAFTVLQNRLHETWSRFFSSTLGKALRYAPSDCFETFPFPENWQTDPTLEAAGKTYYEFRADLMVRNDEGLTKTYNRFHDPENREPAIVKLRELHAAMDRAVLDAYGWDDISTDCEFLLDYAIDEATWGNKRKPYRYRWPDTVHDEVLARLLDLNQKRYAEEVALGLHEKKGKKKRAAKKAITAQASPASPNSSGNEPAQGSLF